MGCGRSGGENEKRGEEFDIFLYPPMVGSKWKFKRIQGEVNDFSSLAKAKEKMKR